MSKRVALVTGGSGGIGQAICKRLAADGFAVVVHYGSNQDGANAVVDEIKQSGGEAVAMSADMTKEDDVVKLFQQIMDTLQRIDVAVANAGVGGGGPVAELELEKFDQLIATNLRGAFLTVREAARKLADNGRIIFISSQLAMRPLPGTGAYSATKAAMDALIVSLADEVGGRGITVNSVRPGATEPGMFASSDEERKEHFRQLSPFKRLGRAEDTANVVSFVASEDASWVTGQHIRADGGASN